MRSGRELVGRAATVVAAAACAVLGLSAAAAAQDDPVPTGWRAIGSGTYSLGADVARRPGGTGWHSATLASAVELPEETGMVLQSIRADEFRGRRIRLTGYLRTDAVAGTAGLFARVDGKEATQTSDYMLNRALSGTQAWRRQTIVLDVPRDAVGITVGFYLSGPGRLWVDDIAMETVGRDVPATGVPGHQVTDALHGFVVRQASMDGSANGSANGSAQRQPQRRLHMDARSAYRRAPLQLTNARFEQLTVRSAY